MIPTYSYISSKSPPFLSRIDKDNPSRRKTERENKELREHKTSSIENKDNSPYEEQ